MKTEWHTQLKNLLLAYKRWTEGLTFKVGYGKIA